LPVKKIDLKQAKDIINQILNGFRDSLKNGERIEIRGFGSFCQGITMHIKERIPGQVQALMCSQRSCLSLWWKGIEGKGWYNRVDVLI